MKTELEQLRSKYPNAELLVHPECIPEVIDFADFVSSTEGMVRHIKESSETEFIVGTEKELSYRLEKENPGKKFYTATTWLCPAMKQITIEDVLKCLETQTPQIELDQEIIYRAQKPLQRMIEIL